MTRNLTYVCELRTDLLLMAAPLLNHIIMFKGEAKGVPALSFMPDKDKALCKEGPCDGSIIATFCQDIYNDNKISGR